MGLIPIHSTSVYERFPASAMDYSALSLEAGFISVEGSSLRSTGPRAAVIRYQTYSSRYVMVSGLVEREKHLQTFSKTMSTTNQHFSRLWIKYSTFSFTSDGQETWKGNEG